MLPHERFFHCLHNASNLDDLHRSKVHRLKQRIEQEAAEAAGAQTGDPAA
jgi:hypothetical protein